ncbi:uncharacterized protein LOC119069442 [Bradysia coprophila]|uniref:uncharacterized protein LOC119069442 n=1 Tax=Bradysia coprophila TaxID=38358 RepID=UPI00187D9678|nr:uncharacterized protein LOC119069442 [Bradysia coprophila]
MENSIDLHESNDTEISGGPSLLLLNNDCLIRIFKCVELLDLVNLSRTCVRFKNIATDTFNPRFKIVTINDISDCDYPESYPSLKVTEQQFCTILSVIGWRVQSVEIYEGCDNIFRKITSKCKNVTSLSLLFIDHTVLSLRTCPHLQEFNKLKELRIIECDIAKDVLRQIFLHNPDIETIECDWAYKGFVKLLKLLPKLKQLHLDSIQGLGVNHSPNLFHLKEVNDFKFNCIENCNKFITQLATKWTLVSLNVTCDTDDETFELLQLFENLEYLEIANMTSKCIMPERTVFPSKLKRISFYNIGLTLRKLTSIVDKTKMLENVALKTQCLIEFSADQEADMIFGIVTALSPLLQPQQRKLKVRYSPSGGWSNNRPKYFYDSENLKIINHICKYEEKKSHEEWASERTSLRIIPTIRKRLNFN